MKKAHFPAKIRSLEPYSERFEAFKMAGPDCDTYFASYPAGTVIEPHSHDTENVGVITQGELILKVDGRETRYSVGDWYHVDRNQVHSARFEVETSEVEFWFK